MPYSRLSETHPGGLPSRLALLLLIGVSPGFGQTVSFANAKRLDIQYSSPFDAVTAGAPGRLTVLTMDLNNDGHQDIVLLDSGSRDTAAGQPVLRVYLGHSTRNFALPSSGCSVPAAAQAYSLNVTVVPPGPLTYLTAWPAGQTQPLVSTLNSFNGAVVANAAIVPAGSPNGSVSIFVSNTTDVILDINAYFAP